MTRLLLALAAGVVVASACTVKDPDDPDDTETGGSKSEGTGGSSSGAQGGRDTGGVAGTGQAGAGIGGAPAEAGSGGANVGPSGTGGAPASGGSNASAGEAGSAPVSGGDTGNPPPSGSDWPDEGRGVTGPLVLEVTTARGPATPGKSLLWTITVGNTSEKAVAGVGVLFRVPEGLAFTYVNDADPDASYCGNGTCGANEEATWEIGALAAGATESISINTSVLGTVGDGDDVRAAIRLSATNVNPLNITTGVPVAASAPVQVAMTADRDPVVPGDRVELSFDLGHVGDTSLYEGELRALLPKSLSIDAIGQDGATADDGAVVWAIGDVPVGSTFRRTVSATVRDDAVPGDILNPMATFSHEDADGAATAALPISVVEEAQPVALTVNVASAPAVPGEGVLYDATISNTSLRAVENLVLTLRNSEALAYQYTVNSDPDSTYCGNGTCGANEEAQWTIPSLPAGTTQTITINPSVVAAAAGDGTLITDSFRLRGSGTNPLNRFNVLPVNSGPGAELALGTAVEPLVPGESFTYDIHVGHIGPATLNDSVLEVQLPAGVSVDAISDGGTESGEGEITWDLGAISVGSSAYRSVTVTLDEDASSATVLEASALLRYEGGAEIDATAAHASSVVESPLPLTVTVEATPDPAVLGERVLYTTTILNTSERAVDGITLLMRVPKGAAFLYTTDADPDSTYCGNGTCSATEEAFWEIATLPAGALQTVTTNAQVAATLVGGSLVTTTQRVTAVNLGGTINLKTTVQTGN
jgi:large repetitive protein